MRELLSATFHHLERCWRPMVLADLLFKAVASFVLTPLIAGLVHLQLSWAGNPVLADLDLLFFLRGPIGWLCLLTVVGLSTGMWALEVTTLLSILSQAKVSNPLSSLWFSGTQVRPVLQLLIRLIAGLSLMSAPFAAVAAALYFLLLGEHDINYYLAERPPEFLLAIGCGFVLVGVLAALLLRWLTNWCLTLPLVVLERSTTTASLQVSQDRTTGHRLSVLGWLLLWAGANAIVSALVTTMILVAARFTLVRLTNSLEMLIVAVGVALGAWAVAQLALSLLSNLSFAALYYAVYQRLSDHPAPCPTLPEPPLRLRGWPLTGILVAAAVVTLTTAYAAVHNLSLEDDVVVIAHRGASADAPENTLAAVERAIEDGTDWVEIDVQETKDGEVVVFHDSDFMKVARSPLKIWDATMEDLQALDIGSWFDPQFQTERVPTLREVLRRCRDRAGVNIELKYYGHQQQLEQRVAAIVDAEAMSEQVMLMSLKQEGVQKMKTLRPDWPMGLLLSVSMGAVKNIPGDFVAINASFVSHDFVRAAHRADKLVYVWTINDAVSMSNLMSLGVDGIITDHPALGRSVLEQRAGMGAPERVLLKLASVVGLSPQGGEQ